MRGARHVFVVPRQSEARNQPDFCCATKTSTERAQVDVSSVLLAATASNNLRSVGVSRILSVFILRSAAGFVGLPRFFAMDLEYHERLRGISSKNAWSFCATP